MNSPWLWITSMIVSSILQEATILKGCVGSGKHITFPMVKVWAYWYAKRILKKTEIRPGDHFKLQISGLRVRFWQWGALFLMLLWVFCLNLAGLHLPGIVDCVVYWWPWGLLHADDLLTTIDQDKWKKRWQSANKIKWKMKLPVHIPQPTA